MVTHGEFTIIFRRISILDNKNNKKRASNYLISIVVVGALALFGIFVFGNSKVINSKTKYYEVLSHYQKKRNSRIDS